MTIYIAAAIIMLFIMTTAVYTLYKDWRRLKIQSKKQVKSPEIVTIYKIINVGKGCSVKIHERGVIGYYATIKSGEFIGPWFSGYLILPFLYSEDKTFYFNRVLLKRAK